MPKHEHMFHHHQAHKLDDPERRTWLSPDDVVRRLELRPGMCVADIGAGTGYFALPIARAVLPGGKVYAVDAQREMLDLLRGRIDPGLPITLVDAEATSTTLEAASVDLVFLANVWHEIDDREAALDEAARILRAGGGIAILDWRTDVAREPGPPPHHRVEEKEVVSSLAAKHWRVSGAEHVGSFSYLVRAARA